MHCGAKWWVLAHPKSGSPPFNSIKVFKDLEVNKPGSDRWDMWLFTLKKECPCKSRYIKKNVHVSISHTAFQIYVTKHSSFCLWDRKHNMYRFTFLHNRHYPANHCWYHTLSLSRWPHHKHRAHLHYAGCCMHVTLSLWLIPASPLVVSIKFDQCDIWLISFISEDKPLAQS